MIRHWSWILLEEEEEGRSHNGDSHNCGQFERKFMGGCCLLAEQLRHRTQDWEVAGLNPSADSDLLLSLSFSSSLSIVSGWWTRTTLPSPLHPSPPHPNLQTRDWSPESSSILPSDCESTGLGFFIFFYWNSKIRDWLERIEQFLP